MAEAGVLATLGWVASPLIKRQINKALDYLGTDAEERRTKLAATVLPSLSLAIEKAEKSPNKEKVETWLKRLKNAYYEAEDVLDLYEYKLLKQKVRDDRKTQNYFKKILDGVTSLSKKKIMLKTCIDKLIEIGKEANEFRNLLEAQDTATISNHERDTLSRSPARIFGREIDKEYISGLLKERPQNSEIGPSTIKEKPPNSKPEPSTIKETPPNSEPGPSTIKEKPPKSEPGPSTIKEKPPKSEPGPSTIKEIPPKSEPGPSTMQEIIPIIAIMGRSGVGKTALAQDIFKCMEEQKHFDQTLWVHVPRIFNAVEVIMNMIKTIKAEKRTLHECNYDRSTPLEVLSKEIKILGSKFLLILDDFWCDTTDFGGEWDKFIKCLGNRVSESRILLTTQCASVKSKTRINGFTEVTAYTLQDLEENKFLELFMHHAWPSGCTMEREKFEAVGRKIAAKLKGDCGAAQILGHQLSQKIDLKHWEEVAGKDWLGDSMNARIWSYKQLPIDLQRCFTFFSLFPKGTALHESMLAFYWMAEGFTKTTHEEATFKNVGDNYVSELVSRFFLEQQANNKGMIYMHDLFHDLAERVRGDEFITEACDNFNKNLSGSKAEGIRHIHLPASMINKLADKICLMKNLCTLIAEPDAIVSTEVLQRLFKHLERLRLIELKSVDDLPDSIGNLKHLRYLCISTSQTLKKVPDSICKLYHLQTLIFANCESLPKNFCELISLRHFVTDSDMESPILNVGRLTSLQIFDKFIIVKKPGHELHQLENLNQLQGQLHIRGLENVVNIEDAIQANLGVKSHLQELIYEWRSDERAIDDLQLLDGLKPHSNIGRLTINGYRGSRLPTWILQQNSFEDLTTLLLLKCNEVEQISTIRESIPSCDTLFLCDLIKLKELPHLPSNLTTLVLTGIPQLSFFSQEDLFGKQERIETILEVLRQITKFVMLSRRLYVELTYESMQFLLFVKERLEAAQEISTMDLHYQRMFSETLRKISNLSPIQFLDAWVMGMRCHLELMFMNKFQKSELVLPSSLTNLCLGSCSITNDALSTGIQSLVFLSELAISKIQTITSLPPTEVFCALKKLKSLTIEKCYLLCSLGGIGVLTSLTDLKLERCLNLKASNKLPSSLRNLLFQECTNAHVILGNSHLPILRDLTLFALDDEMVNLHVGHLSSLETLSIVCQNCQLEGLSSLCSLRDLFAHLSPENSLTTIVDKHTSSLKWVALRNPSQLKLMLSDETISKIEILTIFSILGESLNYEVFSSLKSLTHLMLRNCDITHLLTYMKNLALLQTMYLEDCIGDLNPSELKDFTQNLCELWIKNCPTLMKKSKKVGRPYHVRFENGYTVLRFLTKEEMKPLK